MLIDLASVVLTVTGGEINGGPTAERGFVGHFDQRLTLRGAFACRADARTRPQVYVGSLEDFRQDTARIQSVLSP